MKKLGITIVLVVVACLMSGCAYLYAQFNIHHNTAYYVQHMPRKKGTNPELALITDNVYWIVAPRPSKIDFKSNEIWFNYEEREILLKKEGSGYYLSGSKIKKDYYFYSKGSFSYAEDFKKTYRNNITAQEAEVYSSKILSPFLKDAKKPLINLQWLFNRKYAKRFN